MGKLTRREFIRNAGGFVSAAALSPALLNAAEIADGKRFNILFMMTDQHHHSVLGCAGNPVVKTPNLDRLAAGGARFTNAVCATPFCSPTRASLMTGLWPHTHGIVQNIEDEKLGLKDDVQATEQFLFDKGCETFQMGKWHLGDISRLRCYRKERERVSPSAHRRFLDAISKEKWDKPRGNDVQIGDVCFSPEVVPFHNIWKDEKRRTGQDLSIIGRSLIPAENQFESWLADRCVELVKMCRDENFMITYSVSPPHALWTVPDPFYSMYDPAKMPLPPNWSNLPPDVYKDSQPARLGAGLGETGVREMLRCYYAQVTMMDWCMGRILDALAAEGLDRDTLVVFLSDHGDMNGGHHMIDKALPAFYEEIVRVPMIVRYPRAVKAGTVLDTHANSVDIMPTLLDFAGVPTPKNVQGVSLRPLLEGKAPEDDRPAFCERGFAGPPASRMIRTKRWKYTVFGKQRRELFDLKEDPGEIHNLADDPSCGKVMARLHERLRLQMERTNDPARDVLPVE